MGRGVLTIWLIFAAIAFIVGVSLDMGACVAMAWGKAEEDTYYIDIGLFRVRKNEPDVYLKLYFPLIPRSSMYILKKTPHN